MHKHHEQNTWNEDILFDTDISLIDNKFDIDFSTIDGSFDLELDGMTVIEKDYPLDVDRRSIDINLNSELELMNYGKASQGQMPIYDNETGLKWVDPLSPSDLQAAVEAATAQANLARDYKQESANFAAQAVAAQLETEAIKERVDEKFWFGTITDYNRDVIVPNPDTIYVILT